ncbi:hypothetical protein CPAR01_06069 [Colletotrichum paranaense]|uniref:Uncharacterized protein n=1 Tax=Colletotrichum paranaense TaxID=1914294 RepID=A0ABQ9ST30_9PEZI|nr:uncharacterized protein CPAR01_06069 [Colletotrichum paranaense]KAK1542682.1 hypothetical protein CPAR01_06069 [Colletotrichum paranaense]
MQVTWGALYASATTPATSRLPGVGLGAAASELQPALARACPVPHLKQPPAALSPDATIAQRLRAACILPHLDPKWSARRPSKGPVLFEVPGVKARGSNGTVNDWLFLLRQLPTRSPVRRPTTPSKPLVILRLPQFTDC